MESIKIVMGDDAKKGDVCEQGRDGAFYRVGSGLSCPFCNYKNCKTRSADENPVPRVGFNVVCPQCGAIGPFAGDAVQAIELWSRGTE